MTAVPLALASKKIMAGVAVVCPFEMHPLKIANAVLTLNEYAEGRASVVITSGGDWTGVLKEKPGEVTRTPRGSGNHQGFFIRQGGEI